MELIGIAGAKNAGKDSAAKLITGMVLQKVGMITDYDMTADGELIIYQQISQNGVSKRETSIFPLNRRDEAFVSYLHEAIWPHVKIYHFADPLKYLVSNMFGLDIDVLFGNQEAKESPSSILWERMIDVLPKKKMKKKVNLSSFMTHREVLQHTADILLHVNPDCFINYCIQQIQSEQSPISIIADVRTEHEVDAIKNVGGKVILLTKRPDDGDTHHIENDLLHVDRAKFDIVLDNQNMSIGEKNVKLVNELKNIGFLQ